MPFSTQVTSGRTRVLHTHPGPLYAPEHATTRAIATVADSGDAVALARTLTGIEHAVSVALICGAGDDDPDLNELVAADGNVDAAMRGLSRKRHPDRADPNGEDAASRVRLAREWDELRNERLPRAVADALASELAAIVTQLARDAYETSTPLGATRGLYAYADATRTCDSPLHPHAPREHDLWTDTSKTVTCRRCRAQFTYTVVLDDRSFDVEDAKVWSARVAAQPPASRTSHRRPARLQPARLAQAEDVDTVRARLDAWANTFAGPHVYRPDGTYILMRLVAEQTGGLAGQTPGHLLSFDPEVPPASLFPVGLSGLSPTRARLTTISVGTVAIPSGRLALTPDDYITDGYLLVSPGTYEVTITASTDKRWTKHERSPAFVSVWADRDTPHTTVQRAVDHHGNVMAVRLSFEDDPYPLFVTDQTATPFLAEGGGFEDLYVEDQEGDYDSHPWLDLMDSPDHQIVGVANIPVPDQDELSVVMIDADSSEVMFPVYVTLDDTESVTGWHVDLMLAHQHRPIR